jgi:AhpD family alkylhydroperoxidase
MASSTRVPAAEITGIYGALLKTMSRKMLGQVPEAVGVMWHYPAVFKDMMKFGRKTESWNRLDPNLASFATMAAAGAVGCSFCVDLHYFMTHNRGLDETKAREVPRWRGVHGVHSPGAAGDGVRRGDEPDTADRHRRDVGRAAR